MIAMFKKSMEISRIETNGSPDIAKRYKHSFLVTINRTSYFQCIHGGLPTDIKVNVAKTQTGRSV